MAAPGSPRRSPDPVGPANSRPVRTLFYLSEASFGGLLLYLVVFIGRLVSPALLGETTLRELGLLGTGLLLIAFRAVVLGVAMQYSGRPKLAEEWREERSWPVVIVSSIVVGGGLVYGEILYMRSGQPAPSPVFIGGLVLAVLSSFFAYYVSDENPSC